MSDASAAQETMHKIGLLATFVSAELEPLQLLQTRLGLNRKRPNLLFVVLDQWRWDWDDLPAVQGLAAQGAERLISMSWSSNFKLK